MEGEPRFDDSQALPDFPYAGYAELLGLRGICVDAPADEVDDAWEAALAADRPVVIELVGDPDVPLLPPLPQGEGALKEMRTALEAEGVPAHAQEMLDEYARLEEG